MSAIQEELYQFKNLVLSDKYLDEPSKLATVIGVNDNGEPILFDFAKNPHLFIGGDQGCGKSTLIHSIIMSLMQRNTPDEFQFVYLDAKGLDVNLYKQSKYLHISREHHILDVFNYLLYECNNRTRILNENKKKTVSAYNEFAVLCDDVVPIPELFVFVDEVSYLLEENQIRQRIEELNNYGRAVGIHLVIADTNPTLGNVLKIAKQIPNKIVFRFTYADYKALLERKNVVPLSEDGEILCDFRGAEYVHGHSCFVSEDEIKSEVAKNIVEIKTEKQRCEKATEKVIAEEPILQKEDAVHNKMPYEALRNGETFDLRDYPDYSKLLKELGIVDVDKITEYKKITVTDISHKAKLLGVSEELAEFYGDITLNVYPEDSNSKSDVNSTEEQTDNSTEDFEKESKTERFSRFLSQRKNIVIYGIVAIIALMAIYFVLNIPKETIDKFTPYIIGYGFISCILYFAVTRKSKRIRRRHYSIFSIDSISDGHDFEYVVADLLKGVGFYNVQVTVGSGDYGIDVVGWYDGASYAIQCKKYSGKVGVAAVQEAYAGRSYYGCNYAMVITNNYFTPAAIKLAKSTGVILWDRNNVKRLLKGRI